MEVEQIENAIKGLKDCKNGDAKRQQYNLIATGLNGYFRTTGIKHFQRSLILSFFEMGFYPMTTQNRHVKAILNTLKEKGLIIDEEQNKTALQRRVYELKSNDFDSYNVLMAKNGYSKVDCFKFVVDKSGIPRRVKIGTTDLNGELTDENGDFIDYDLRVLRQTKTRDNQGVYSYGNKSIAIEKRPYSVKGFRVI